MSLYEGIDPPEKGAGGSWSSQGLKLLQSQIALKKAQATQAMRDRARAQQAESRSEPPPAVDLSSANKLASMLTGTAASGDARRQPATLKPRKALMLDAGPPLSFMGMPKEDQVVIFGEYTVVDEYNPLLPNDFAKVFAQLQAQKAHKKAEQIHQKEIRKRQKQIDRDEEQEARKRTMGAAIAPPQQLMDQDKMAPDCDSGPAQPEVCGLGDALGLGKGPRDSSANAPKGLAMAARFMQKYGYKEGSGLGSRNQGMAAPLHVQRMGFNAGKIVQLDAGDQDTPEQTAPGFSKPPPPHSTSDNPSSDHPAVSAAAQSSSNRSNAELLRSPSKVVLLRNMVGRGEVDSELEPETREEMCKYGTVDRCMIYEMPAPAADNDAVRIFVQFAKVDQAMKAVIDLNGRWFGGRQVRATFYDADRFASNQLSSDS